MISEIKMPFTVLLNEKDFVYLFGLGHYLVFKKNIVTVLWRCNQHMFSFKLYKIVIWYMYIL